MPDGGEVSRAALAAYAEPSGNSGELIPANMEANANRRPPPTYDRKRRPQKIFAITTTGPTGIPLADPAIQMPRQQAVIALGSILSRRAVF